MTISVSLRETDITFKVLIYCYIQFDSKLVDNQNVFLDINRKKTCIPMIYHSGFLHIFAYDIRFSQGNGYSHKWEQSI